MLISLTQNFCTYYASTFWRGIEFTVAASSQEEAQSELEIIINKMNNTRKSNTQTKSEVILTNINHTEKEENIINFPLTRGKNVLELSVAK